MISWQNDIVHNYQETSSYMPGGNALFSNNHFYDYVVFALNGKSGSHIHKYTTTICVTVYTDHLHIRPYL